MFLQILSVVILGSVCVAERFQFPPDVDNVDKLIDVGGLMVSLNCLRPCLHTNQPKICYFKFTLEHYTAMGIACGNCSSGVQKDCYNSQCVTADGVERGITVVNRAMPGPSIQVCKNDQIVVDVDNRSKGHSATIHWHGMLQRGTPYMDGVPMVTQCPILPDNSFRYHFFAKDSGTYFWHSHAGFDRVGGQFGALIIREPKEGNPHCHLYVHDKKEHVMLVSDYSYETPDMFFPGCPTRKPGIFPSNLLCNGKGRYTDPITGKRVLTPYATFYVDQGQSYRFRIINSGSFICPTQIQIYQHDFTIIETDGNNILPKKCDTITIYAGERYSVIVTADQPPGIYWIRLRAVGLCQARGPLIDQFAVFVYKSAPGANVRGVVPRMAEPGINNTWPSEIIFNPFNCIPCKNSICVGDLSASLPDYSALSVKPDKNIYMAFGFQNQDPKVLFSQGTYTHFMEPSVITAAYVNQISLVSPPGALLSQFKSLKTCSKGNLPDSCKNNTKDQLCYCAHVINIKFNDVVEILLDSVDVVPFVAHPFHLHGYAFQVIKVVAPGNSSCKGDEEPRHHGSCKIGPLKDVIAVPSGGYAVIRFRADNPGYWFFHCHFEWHMVVGMAVVLRVGNPEYDLPPIPPGFPKCGNYLPALKLQRGPARQEKYYDESHHHEH